MNSWCRPQQIKTWQMKSIEKVQSAKLATNEKLRKLSISTQALDQSTCKVSILSLLATFKLSHLRAFAVKIWRFKDSSE